MIVAVLTCAILVVLVALYKEYTKQVPANLPPKVSGALPYFGNLTAIINPNKFFPGARAKHGDIYRFTLFGTEWMVLTGRQYFNEYFRAREDTLSFKALQEFIRTNRMIHGVDGELGIALNDHTLSALKKALSVKAEETIVRVALEEIESLPESGTLKLMEFSQRLIARVVCAALYGMDDLPNDLYENLQEYAHLIDQGCAMFTLSKPIVNNLIIPKLDRVRAKILVHLIPIVAEARKNGASSVYVQSLLNQKIQVGQEQREVTDAEVAACMAQLHFAAVNMTGRALANVLLMIADHPEKAQDLREELRDLSNTSVVENKTLQSWIDETARLSKGFVGSVRIVTSDNFQLAGYDIPKGTKMFVDSFVESMENNEISDRDEFRPERWLQTDEKVDKNLNWGSGIHLCPGRNFAYVELRLSVAQFLKKINLNRSQRPFENYPTFSDPFKTFPKSYSVTYTKA